MQIEQRFVIITISVLALVSIVGLSMRAHDLKSPSSVPAESPASSDYEEHGMTERKESGRSPTSSILDLTRTPAQTQTALSFLLLLPVGLLITALARSVVGIHTIGTFSPTLLALSQARSDWRIGTVMFVVIFGLGSLCRMLLARLKLSTVPRRGVIGTFVVLAIATAISLASNYGLAPTARHVLLPVAVMTIMIERFFTIVEKEGNRTALTILANSIAVAVCCFVVFAYTRTGHFLLRFPELEFLIMAVLILVGRYSGRPLLGTLGLQGNGSSEEKGTQ